MGFKRCRQVGAPFFKIRCNSLGISDDNGRLEQKYKEERDAKEKEKPTFAPRQYTKKKPNEGKYMDRAEMRRQGIDDEYKPVSLQFPGV